MAEDRQLKDFSECLAGLLGDEAPEFVESVLLSGSEQKRENKQRLEEQWSMPAVDLGKR